MAAANMRVFRRVTSALRVLEKHACCCLPETDNFGIVPTTSDNSEGETGSVSKAKILPYSSLSNLSQQYASTKSQNVTQVKPQSR